MGNSPGRMEPTLDSKAKTYMYDSLSTRSHAINGTQPLRYLLNFGSRQNVSNINNELDLSLAMSWCSREYDSVCRTVGDVGKDEKEPSNKYGKTRIK